MSRTGPGREANDVARLIERLRLAEARLVRQHQDGFGLNDSDRATIRYIVEHGDDGVEITPSTLAEHLHLTGAAMTAVLDRLVVNGFVAVEPHPTDRRKKLVTLFDHDIDPDHIDPLTMRIRHLAAELPSEQAAVITRFLRGVIEILSEKPTD